MANKKDKKNKLNLEAAYSYLALVILSGAAYAGFKSLINSQEYVAEIISAIIVLLLIKTVVKK